MPSQMDTTQVGDLIALIILFHDHLLTFPAEVCYFWRRSHINLGLVLFLINRYFALCLHIFNVVRLFTITQDENKVSVSCFILKLTKESYNVFSCVTVEITTRSGIVVIQLFCAVLMAMRVYALYEKSRIILTSLWIVAAGILGFSCWAFIFNPYRKHGMEYVCHVDPATALHMAILWGGQLAFDTIIFILTLWKSYCIGKLGDRSLVDILLRDGAMYFAIISCVNAVNIAILLLQLAIVGYKSISGTFTNSLNVILVSRLMLNLQECSHRGSVDDTNGPMTMTSVVSHDDGPSSMFVDDSNMWSARHRGARMGGRRELDTLEY